MAHVVAVHHIECALLAYRQGEMFMSAGLIRKNQDWIVEIEIILAEVGLVVRREPVGELQSRLWR